MNGSVISFISKSQLDKIKIPIPKTEEKIKYWTDKISKPYNKKDELKNKLDELEKEIKDRIQYITDNEECEEVELGNICEYIKTGKHITNRNGNKYPYYGTSKIICYLDSYLFEGKHISISRKGDCIINILDKKFTSNDDTILLKCNKINTYNLYFILISNKDSLFNYYGSTVKGIKKTEIEKIKIKLPKNKQLITDLEPKFEEIEKIKEELEIQENLFNQYVEELGQEAIKDTSNETKSIKQNMESKKSKKCNQGISDEDFLLGMDEATIKDDLTAINSKKNNKKK